ncbi:MAG: hypothetical protein PHH77_02980 [Victivallaceae bacterium]|nr:hypothetical protein [Victivallaceae bacterium]
MNFKAGAPDFSTVLEKEFKSVYINRVKIKHHQKGNLPLNTNRTKMIFMLSVAAMAIFPAGGCMQFDYVGQKLAPLKPDQAVAFYNSKDSVPPDTYKVLGRAEITAPDGTNTEEVKAELIEKAREYGANAIEVVSFKRVKTGEVEIPQNEAYGSNDPVGTWAVTSNRPDGTPIYTDSFVKTIPLEVNVIEKYEIQAKVLFLADKERVNKNIEAYKKKRKSYLHSSSRFAQ